MKTQTHPLGPRVTSTLLGIGIGLLLAGAAPRAQASNNFPGTAFAYPGTTESLGFNTTSATAQAGELSHHLSPQLTAFHSWWFTLTVQKTGYISLDTIGSAYNTVLAVYTGAQVNALTKVAGDDTSGGSTTSKVTFLAKAGTIYRVAVDGSDATEYGVTNLHATGFVPLQAKTWIDVLQNAAVEGSGIISLKTTTTGAVSGTLKMGARSHPFTAHMSNTGRILTYISRASAPGQSPALLDVTQDAAGIVLNGTLAADTEDTNESSTVTLEMRSPHVFTAANPCPRKGLYTFYTGNITGIGYNFGTLTVGNLGAITVAGFRGDGVSFTLAGPELNPGALTSGLFRARAVLGVTGHVTVGFTVSSSVTPATVRGDFAFRRPIKPGAVFLPGGVAFNGSGVINGSLYVPPPPNTRMSAGFNATSGRGRLVAQSSSGVLDHIVFLSTANTFTYTLPNTPMVKLTVNKANGQISGTALIGGKSCVMKGVTVPGNLGFRGFTQGLASNGLMSLEPEP